MKSITGLHKKVEKSIAPFHIHLDSKGNYLAVNSQFSQTIFTSSNAWKDRSFFDDISANSLPHAKDAFNTCIAQPGEVFSFEVIHINILNQQISIQWEVSSVFVKDEFLLQARGAITNSAPFPSKIDTQKSTIENNNSLPLPVLNNLLNSSTEIICAINEEGNFFKISAACKKVWGYEPEELEGKHFIDVVYSEDAAKTIEANTILKAGKSLNNFENRCVKKDGSLITIFWTAKWNEADKMMYCTAKDGTRRKENENAINASKQKYRLLFFKSPQPMWIYDVDTFRFLEVNEAAINHYGYSRQEFLSMTIKDIRTEEEVERLLTTEAGLLSPANKTYWKHKKKNGETIDVEVTAHSMDFEGRKAKLKSVNDITEHLKAERELITSNERYAYASKASFDAIWDWDMRTNELYWSDSYETLFGYKPSNYREPLSIWLNKVHPDDRPRVEEKFLNGIKTKDDVWEDEYRFMKADNSYACVMDRGIIIRNENNKAYRMIGVIHDYSDKQKNEESLKELNASLEKRASELISSNEELERFAYVASHDLQEPLRMVSSFLQLLQKRYKAQLDDKANEYIHFAVDGAERMKALILDLLKYSRVNTMKEDHENVDLNETCKNILLTFKQLTKQTNATIEIDALPEVQGTKTQLFQLFQNLIGNALKYIGDLPPKIKIGVVEEQQFWQFYVQDNGIGIDPRFYDKIFVIFQRLHHKNEYTGTGIGLAICKKIVERHGGKIWVEPGEGGLGSTFYFTLKKKHDKL